MGNSGHSIENLLAECEDLFQDIFTGMSDLFLDNISDNFRISLIDNYSLDGGFYSGLPSSSFKIEKEPAFPLAETFKDIEDELEREYDKYRINLEGEEDEPEEPTLISSPVRESPYYGNIIIRKVPRYQLGYHVLGRAFPYLGIVEIAADLYGQDFDEVKTHELMHMKHPQASELEVRRMTKEMLPFPTRFH